MPSERKVRKFIRQWRKRYPYPVAWVDDRANKQCRRSEAEWLSAFDGASTLRRRDVRTLIEWRFSASAIERGEALETIAGPAEWGRARRSIKRALATSNAMAALDCLLGECGGVPGWGPVMASVVLAACRPTEFVVADERALRSLRALGIYEGAGDGAFGRADWWPYLQSCRKLATTSGVVLRHVEQALRAAADDAPRPPKAPGVRGREVRM